MPLVTTAEQIRRSIASLDVGLSQPQTSHAYSVCVELIHKGRCLLPYEHKGALRFAPSRFVGYVGNTLGKHIAGTEGRDGRETNVALSKVLGLALTEDQDIELKFVEFCRQIRGALPLKVPSIQRKYWMTEDAVKFSTESLVAAIQCDMSIPETTRKALIDARLGQGKFRRQLEKYWKRSCAITMAGPAAILKASHIRPWKSSDNAQRLDVYNGLLLSPNLDSLFDRGYITFDCSGTLIVSPVLKDVEKAALLPATTRTLELTEAHQAYMDFHRNNIFQSGET